MALFDKPIVFEVFTDPDCESEALKTISNILKGGKKSYLNKVKGIVKKLLKK